MEFSTIINWLGAGIGVIAALLTGDAALDDFFDASYRSEGWRKNDRGDL